MATSEPSQSDPRNGPAPRRTPLADAHVGLGARLIDFGGWSLPVSYGPGILAEHHATRNAVGIFDVSHMGEAHFRGPGALATLQRLVTNDVGRLNVGQALYTVACHPTGGIVDDLIVYRLGDAHYMAVINAANTAKDLAWFRENLGPDCQLTDASDDTALIAFQGPKALATLGPLLDRDAASLPSFHLAQDVKLAGRPATLARTGYTGEDGVEIFLRPEDAPAVFAALVEAASAVGGLPAGLGARDTLRLEARLPLYGNDLDDTTTPLEAGLGWVVKLDKGDFIGRESLAAQKAAGVRRRLTGFVVEGRGIPRHGYPVLAATAEGPAARIGVVTSGGVGPTVGKNIALAYVPVDGPPLAQGSRVFIDCRGKPTAAEVVTGPFYKRAR